MNRNVRLIKDVKTSMGMCDVYAIESRTLPLGTEVVHGWETKTGDDITLFMSKKDFNELPIVRLEICRAEDPNQLGWCVGHPGAPSNTGDPHIKGFSCNYWKPMETTK